MLIKESVYKFSPIIKENINTFLRFENIVDDINDADIVLISCYDFDSKWVDKEKLYKLFREHKNKIIIDNTAELLSIGFFKYLQDIDDLSHITIYANGYDSGHQDHTFLYLEIIKSKGINIVILPFFVKYNNQYVPINNSNQIPYKKFLYMVGKPKQERVILLGLLSYHDLLKLGHVSYFGDNQEANFQVEREVDYLKSDLPENQKFKVHVGLNKLEIPLTLDSKRFDYEISHTRDYVSDYYLASDFVIVAESDIKNVMFITEKIMKCVQLNKKFILLGSPGLLEFTREQCLEHLNLNISNLIDWCDTSYDKIENEWERIEKIVEIVKKYTTVKEYMV